MDGPWPQVILYLAACAAPMSVLAWTLMILSRGWLRDPDDQPVVFGYVAARVGSWVAEEGPTFGVVVLGMVLWGMANYAPLAVLATWPYGWLGRAIALAYFVGQGIWLISVRRAIVRSTTRG